jgi:toxin-antitoxin system PIN domain toxin
VIAVDTNILVYAHRRDSVWHDRAADCVRSLAEGRAHWLIPWPCLHEFLSIVTHPRIYSPPSSIADAVRQIEYWMASPALLIGGEAAGHWRRLRELVIGSKISGPLIHDARVAAICLDHGVESLWSSDRDFSRFSHLVVSNPLLEA